MSVWMTILLTLVSQVVLPLVVEWLKKILDKTKELTVFERRVARKELTALLKSMVVKRRGKANEYRLARDDDGMILTELEAFYDKVASKVVA